MACLSFTSDFGLRREVVIAEELILPWTRLVDLEVAREAICLLDGHPLLGLEALSGKQFLLDIGPLWQSLPP